jgi:hypothetical protein
MQADRVRDTALVVLGRDNPNLVSEFAGDLFENFETRRFDTVVIGYENTIQHSAASLSPNSPPDGWLRAPYSRVIEQQQTEGSRDPLLAFRANLEAGG